MNAASHAVPGDGLRANAPGRRLTPPITRTRPLQPSGANMAATATIATSHTVAVMSEARAPKRTVDRSFTGRYRPDAIEHPELSPLQPPRASGRCHRRLVGLKKFGS